MYERERKKKNENTNLKILLLSLVFLFPMPLLVFYPVSILHFLLLPNYKHKIQITMKIRICTTNYIHGSKTINYIFLQTFALFSRRNCAFLFHFHTHPDPIYMNIIVALSIQFTLLFFYAVGEKFAKLFFAYR